MSVVIRTEGLSKVFGTRRAVEDLTLTVERGEVFGYLGPNGAGKTTTIRMLLDLARPTAGTYSVFGGSGADPSVRRRIGYVPGELHLDPSYTARELFEFHGALRGKLDTRWLGELVERFDLDPARRIGELSTGNRRKVGILQAFMQHPELLLLDEPTSGLDPLLQIEFQRLVRDVVAEGSTVFLSSHMLHEVNALADRVAILREGRHLITAPVSELSAQARQRIDVHLAKPCDTTALRDVSGVIELTVTGSVVQLVVEGPVGPVIRALGGFDVTRIVTHDDDLEDAFLRYYRGDAG